jgi:hypothetical protein
LPLLFPIFPRFREFPINRTIRILLIPLDWGGCRGCGNGYRWTNTQRCAGGRVTMQRRGSGRIVVLDVSLLLGR